MRWSLSPKWGLPKIKNTMCMNDRQGGGRRMMEGEEEEEDEDDDDESSRWLAGWLDEKIKK